MPPHNTYPQFSVTEKSVHVRFIWCVRVCLCGKWGAQMIETIKPICFENKRSISIKTDVRRDPFQTRVNWSKRNGTARFEELMEEGDDG